MKKILFALTVLVSLPGIHAQDILVLHGAKISDLSMAEGLATNLYATGSFDSVDAVVWDSANEYDLNYLNNYDALVTSEQSSSTSYFRTIDIPTHPALNFPFVINTATWNVGNLWSSTSTTLSPEAYSIAKFADSRPDLQATKNVGVNGAGRVIDLTVYHELILCLKKDLT